MARWSGTARSKVPPGRGGRVEWAVHLRQANGHLAFFAEPVIDFDGHFIAIATEVFAFDR